MNADATTAPENRQAGSNPELVAIIREEIVRAGGQITIARFMELALYHPDHGYYLAPDRRPGRGGDFLTSPEASPYFGITLARQIAECWERLGRPRPFSVREYGAGVGGLAYDVIAGLHDAAPALLDGLDYRLVEPNRHRVAQAMAAMAEVGFAGIVTAEEPPTSGADLPPITGVILANEVADAFPVHRLVARDGGFREHYVIWAANVGESGWFAVAEGDPSSPELVERWDALRAAGVTPAEGNLLEVSPAASAWFAGVGRGLARGYVIVIDYGYPATELYSGHRLGGLLRGYAEHTVTDDPFARIGNQDLTAHVDFTALEAAGIAAGLVPAGLTTQGAFLSSLGLGDVLLGLQADPATGPAEYYAAQAAVMRLIEPGGLGRFRVLLMARDAPIDPPLKGLSIRV
jgi:SAM-dependent MidA family methyltransferase